MEVVCGSLLSTGLTPSSFHRLGPWTSKLHNRFKTYDDFKNIFTVIVCTCALCTYNPDSLPIVLVFPGGKWQGIWQWRVTCDIWHMTFDMWHMIFAKQEGPGEKKVQKWKLLAKHCPKLQKCVTKAMFHSIGATIRTCRESQCLPYARFFWCSGNNSVYCFLVEFFGS